MSNQQMSLTSLNLKFIIEEHQIVFSDELNQTFLVIKNKRNP